MTFVPNHPIVAATHSLRPSGDLTIAQSPAFRPLVARIVSETQIGTGFHEGEMPLAVIEHRLDDRQRARGSFGAFVVSDRRLYGRLNFTDCPDRVVDVWHSQVMNSTLKSGLMGDKTFLQTMQGQVEVPILGKSIHAFYMQTLRIPPQHRTMGPDAFDGGRAVAAQSLGDPRTSILCQLIDAGVQDGRIKPEQARALFERTLIFDRHTALSRGMHQTQWLSVLPRQVLREVLFSLFGPRFNGGVTQTSEMHDFTLNAGRSSSSNAALSTAIGVASLAVLGVGWISRSGEAPPRLLRFHIGDAPCGCMFTLGASNGGAVGRMSLSGSALFRALHDQLVRLEGRQLLADVVSKEVPFDQRLTLPPPIVLDLARTFVPNVDLRAFA